jgi:hypothetical protein
MIKVKNKNPKAAEMMRAFGDDWTDGVQKGHDVWVMRVLEYIVRFSRVDTGRSRAGWFRFMDIRGYNYQRSLPPTGVEDATEEGRSKGEAISEPFLTTIINNVDYVDPMNQRYGLFNFGPVEIRGKKRIMTMSQGMRLEDRIPLFEQYGADNYQKFTDNAIKAYEAGGANFKPGPIEPVENEPPMTV